MPEGVYVEGTLARLKPDGVATLAPAGGSRLLLRRGGKASVTVHTLRGSWLGLASPDPDDERSQTLCTEDELVLASDGLFDQLEGLGKSSDALNEWFDNSKEMFTILDVVHRAVQTSLQGCPQKDDITAVMVRRCAEIAEVSQGASTPDPVCS